MIFKTLLPVYGAQLARLTLPLLVLPIVARRLEIDAFAALMSAQALAYLVMILPEYGFATHGARAVAQARGEAAGLAAVARAIVAAKIALCLPAIAIGTIAGAVLPVLGGDGMLVAVLVALGLALGLSPAWFFQGIGRAQTYAYVEIGAMIAFLLLVLSVPFGPNDAALVLALQAVPLAIAVAAGHVALLRRTGWGLPSAASVVDHLRRGFALFVAKLASNGPGLGLVYVAGFLMAPPLVAAYAAAERVTMGAGNALWPIMQVFMPEIASRRDRDPAGARRVFVRASLVLLAIGIGLAGFLVLFAPQIVAILFGPAYPATVEILRIAAFALPAIALVNALANGYLVVRGRDGTVMAVQVFAASAAVGGALVIAGAHEPTGLAALRVAVEYAALGAMALACLVQARWAPLVRERAS